MSDFLYQNSGYVIPVISIFIITGFNVFYLTHSNRQKTFSLAAQRRVILRLIVGIFLFIGLALVVMMLIIGFQKAGADFGRWAFAFILGLAFYSVVMTVVILYLVKRRFE